MDSQFSQIYDELRRIARQKLAALPAGQTLQATALVHEAWLKLSKASSEVEIEDPRHLRMMLAQAMRWILVDRARHRGAKKRSSDPADLLAMAPAPQDGEDDTTWQRLDRALAQLEQLDARRYRVVLMRFFAGLSVEETASHLDTSTATVKRDWKFARAWLLHAMSEESDDLPDS